LRPYKGLKIAACVKHVSRSGMMRVIDFYVIGKDDRTAEPFIYSIAHLVAKILDWRYTNRNDRGVVVNGCGMDMIFHTIYSLNSAMGRADGLEYKAIDHCKYFFDANQIASL